MVLPERDARPGGPGPEPEQVLSPVGRNAQSGRSRLEGEGVSKPEGDDVSAGSEAAHDSPEPGGKAHSRSALTQENGQDCDLPVERQAGLRVVVAEDLELVRKVLRITLAEEAGVEVVGEAEDGRQAAALAASLEPDVLLMDFCMPGMDGPTAIAAVKQANPRTKVVVLSAHDGADRVRAALAAGADGYLLKNSRAAELAAALRQVVSGGRCLSPEIAFALTAPSDSTA